MVIHTIGDSHSNHGWNSNVISHSFEDMSCYDFAVNRFKKVDIQELNINNGDSIIFCFGYIDCKYYIQKNINDFITYQQVINYIIINYFKYISFIINNSGVNFKKICVYNVIPLFNEKYNTYEYQDYTTIDINDVIKYNILYFNTKIKEYCELNNYIFFDIYDKYTDENGFLKKDLSDGGVHIKNGIYIDEFITNNDI